MRSRILLLAITLALLATGWVGTGSASAAFAHVVAPGESLSSDAAADGLTVSQLAAANGIAPDAQLVAGTTLQIPAQTGASSAAPAAPAAPAVSAGGVTSASTPSAPASTGDYVVAPGDTLSAIAAANGVSVETLAAANGLDPAGILPAGATLSLSGASPSSAPSRVAATPVSAAPGGGPQPTPETVSPTDVGAVAAANGVSPSLAEAIGYLESGFNNDLVSSTGATGVMQIEPGTWNYIGQTLATPPPLSPASATDNVRGGVLLLHSLLDQTGGDPGLAAAAYYQGLESVRKHGMNADTQRYVNNVMALRQRFGAP